MLLRIKWCKSWDGDLTANRGRCKMTYVFVVSTKKPLKKKLSQGAKKLNYPCFPLCCRFSEEFNLTLDLSRSMSSVKEGRREGKWTTCQRCLISSRVRRLALVSHDLTQTPLRSSCFRLWPLGGNTFETLRLNLVQIWPSFFVSHL